MNTSNEMRTSVTLLGRLKLCPTDQAAWTCFVERYGPVILGWSRKFNLQKADAEDVTQNVLVKLLAALKRFEYNADRGTFRGFLQTVTRNACNDYVSSAQFRERGKGGSEVQAALDQHEAQKDLAERLWQEFDKELMEEAFRLVQQRVEPHNWQAFYLRHVEEISGVEVAKRLGMQRATVYGVAKRVQSMVAEEIARLRAQELGDGDVPV